MIRKCGQFLAFAITICILSGCGVPPETLDAIRQATASSDYLPAPSANRIALTQASPEFDPTHPDRVDPFAFPDSSTLENPGTDNSVQSAAQVDVMGFANLGQPRVFLRARETTHSLAVGDKVHGVEVVEINPPAVRLRMGSLTWTTSMFDKVSQ